MILQVAALIVLPVLQFILMAVSFFSLWFGLVADSSHSGMIAIMVFADTNYVSSSCHCLVDELNYHDMLSCAIM